MNTHPTKIALALMALGGFSAQASANLVITEYIEGAKGNNKAVEISNMGNVAVDLEAEGYSLNKYTNGQGNLTSEPLSGVIQPGQSFVYVNSGADLFDPSKWISLNRIVSFNGDDPIVLMKGDAVVDRVGQYGPDPGEGWEVPGTDFSTANKTLRRQSTITVGDADLEGEFPANVNDWAVFDPSVVDGLGCPGVDACGAGPAPEGVLLITEYIEGSSNNKVIEISNVGDADLDLDANEYKLVLFSNFDEPEKPGSTEILSGILKPNESLVFYNNSAKDEFKKTGTASTVTYFNGDDTLILYKDDVVIDRFGKLGEKITWEDDATGFSSANKTLRRKESVTAGDTDPKAPFPGANVQWAVFDIDTSDGIGCPGESACGDEPGPGPDPDEPPCTNCEVIDKVADASKFNPDAYYSNVLNGDFASPAEWKAAISVEAAKGHQKLTYKQVWSVLTYSDEDPTDNTKIIQFYSGTSASKMNNGGDATDWNREHVWPKSHGFESEGMLGYTDAHHLRPTLSTVNSHRSNLDFDAVSALDDAQEIPNAPGNFKTGSAFEPRDVVKGDVARMMFYMDTRYEGGEGMPDLLLVDNTNSNAEQAEAGKLCTLYQWHFDDPVDATDRQRNNAVYEYQGNRNPYIDNPDWVQQVYGAACGDSPEPELEVSFVVEGPTSAVEGYRFTLDATKTTAANGKPLTFKWSQVSGVQLIFTQEGAVLSAISMPVFQDEVVGLELTVTDGELTATHSINVTIEDKAIDADIQFVGETTVVEGAAVSVEATPAQTEAGDVILYTWTQVSGTPVEFEPKGAVLSFTAPEVALDTQLVFSVEAFDGRHHGNKQVSVTVKNDPGYGWTEPEGGALGALLMLLAPLAFWRRRQS